MQRASFLNHGIPTRLSDIFPPSHNSFVTYLRVSGFVHSYSLGFHQVCGSWFQILPNFNTWNNKFASSPDSLLPWLESILLPQDFWRRDLLELPVIRSSQSHLRWTVLSTSGCLQCAADRFGGLGESCSDAEAVPVTENIWGFSFCSLSVFQCSLVNTVWGRQSPPLAVLGCFCLVHLELWAHLGVLQLPGGRQREPRQCWEQQDTHCKQWSSSLAEQRHLSTFFHCSVRFTFTLGAKPKAGSW